MDKLQYNLFTQAKASKHLIHNSLNCSGIPETAFLEGKKSQNNSYNYIHLKVQIETNNYRR